MGFGCKKTLNITGNIGADESNPAVRINSGGNGEIIVKVQSGSYPVRGLGLGGGASQSGQAGNIAMHVASPIKMPTTHYNGRVGGGEEVAVARAAKAVQAVTMEVVGVMVVSVGILINIAMAMAVQAVEDGGGAGGRGNGYYYDYANGIWQRVNNNSNNGLVEQGVLRVPVEAGRAAQGCHRWSGAQGGGLEQSGDNGNTGNRWHRSRSIW